MFERGWASLFFQIPCRNIRRPVSPAINSCWGMLPESELGLAHAFSLLLLLLVRREPTIDE